MLVGYGRTIVRHKKKKVSRKVYKVCVYLNGKERPQYVICFEVLTDESFKENKTSSENEPHISG
jgi:hypothetical protein